MSDLIQLIIVDIELTYNLQWLQMFLNHELTPQNYQISHKIADYRFL